MIRFALVGYGNIGKRHAYLIQAHPLAELRAVVETDLSKHNLLKVNFPLAHLYDSIEKMLEEETVDVAIIATPHFLHAKQSIQCLQRKIHVLVEKPMALSCSDGRKMIQTASQNEVKLWVVKQNRFNEPIKIVSDILNANKLGKIYSVQCNVYWHRNPEYYSKSSWRGVKEFEGGVLFTQVSHFIDILTCWFGELIHVSGFISNLKNSEIEVEDCGSASVWFQNGIIGTITWSNDVYEKNWEGSISIIAEYGTIKIGGAYLNQIEYWNVLNIESPEILSNAQPNEYLGYQGSSNNHHQVLNEIINNLQGLSSNNVEGIEGLKSITAIELMYRCLKRIAS